MTDTLTPDENRTVIAALALAGLLANPSVHDSNIGFEDTAIEALDYTNALLKALEKAAPAADPVGKAKLAAGDCVEYLTSEFDKDKPTSVRVYPRSVNGAAYEVRVGRHADFKSLVATQACIDELRDAFRIVISNKECLKPNCDMCEFNRKRLDAALTGVTALPKPSKRAINVVHDLEPLGGWGRDMLLEVGAAFINAALATSQAKEAVKEQEADKP